MKEPVADRFSSRKFAFSVLAFIVFAAMNQPWIAFMVVSGYCGFNVGEKILSEYLEGQKNKP